MDYNGSEPRACPVRVICAVVARVIAACVRSQDSMPLHVGNSGVVTVTPSGLLQCDAPSAHAFQIIYLTPKQFVAQFPRTPRVTWIHREARRLIPRPTSAGDERPSRHE